MDVPKNITNCRCNDMSVKDYSPSYATFNLIVTMTALPIVALFGLVSNVINIFIFTRRRFSASTLNIFLLLLSCSDFFTTGTGLFLFCSDSARVYVPSLTRLATGLLWVLPVGYTAQTCSVYFTLSAAVACYFKLRPCVLSCTTRSAKLAALAVGLFGVIYNSPRFWQFELNTCFDGDNNITKTELCPTSFYHDTGTAYNVYMYTIVMTAFPFVSLALLNVLIIAEVKRQKRHRLKVQSQLHMNTMIMNPILANGQQRVLNRLLSDKNRNLAVVPVDDGSVISLITVVVLFLVCNVLALVINVVETFFAPDALLVQFMTDTSNFLVILNSSINFLIYMLLDKKYKEEFMWRLFRKKKNLLNGLRLTCTNGTQIASGKNVD